VDITEVRIFPKEGKDKKLKAYAAVTFDSVFVVRNIKIIEGSKGLFVAMPSRKLREACAGCGFTNPVKSKFCNECGKAIAASIARVRSEANFHEDTEQRQSDHRDIAHPITPEFRDYLQTKVLTAFQTEKPL
jgi:stage V sporulation protein G